MTRRSVILLGGPDSGKTNYIGRLWPALDAKTGVLIAVEQPKDIGFAMDTAEHLFQGHFAPRTEHADDRRDFEITVGEQNGGEATAILVPDISGELWLNAVIESEISSEWMSELENSDGAILFVRVGSDLEVRPLDWVTSRRLLEHLGQDDQDREKLPTQVMVCELVRYLEETMKRRPDGQSPRLAVVVAAWDRVDGLTFEGGPIAHLEKEYPLLSGKLADTAKLDVKIFGLSVVGGDLDVDSQFRDQFLDNGLDGTGWVAIFDQEEGQWKKDSDITLPVSWAVGR